MACTHRPPSPFDSVPYGLGRARLRLLWPAAYYTCLDSFYDRLGMDQAPVVQQAGLAEYINPLLAGGTAGLLYKSMGKSARARPRMLCVAHLDELRGFSCPDSRDPGLDAYND